MFCEYQLVASTWKLSNCADSKEWVPIAAQPFLGWFTGMFSQTDLSCNMPEERLSWRREKCNPWRHMKMTFSSLFLNNVWPTCLVEQISFLLKTCHSKTQFHKMSWSLQHRKSFLGGNSVYVSSFQSTRSTSVFPCALSKCYKTDKKVQLFITLFQKFRQKPTEIRGICYLQVVACERVLWLSAPGSSDVTAGTKTSI